MLKVGDAVESQSYYSFGLHFNSTLELPELPLAPSSPTFDVAIRIAEIPDDLLESSELLDESEFLGEAIYQVAPQDFLIVYPEIARYRVKNGCEITIDPAPRCVLNEVRNFLYSVAFGALFHQRRLLPIHASVIETGNGCLAFAGNSGAGKSTLVTYLQEQGYSIVADDLCLLANVDGQDIQVMTGVTTIRLWKDALDIFGKDVSRYQRVHEEVEKYKVPPRRLSTKRSLPLLGIVQIGKPETDQVQPIRRLHGIDAVQVFLEAGFWDYFVHRMGQTGRHFHTAVNVANNVPIYRCCLDKNWQRMQAIEAFVHKHIDL